MKEKKSAPAPAAPEGLAAPGEPLTIEWWPIDRPQKYEKNARVLSSRAIEVVAASIREFGWRQPIVCDAKDVIIMGHTRLLAAQELKLAQVPVHVATGLTPAQVKSLRLMDNRSSTESDWNIELVEAEMVELNELAYDLSLTGFTEKEVAALFAGGGLTDPDAVHKTLAERFGVPPFSVLDARQGYWQERKRAWLSLGIQSELGRGGSAVPGGAPMPLDRAKNAPPPGKRA